MIRGVFSTVLLSFCISFLISFLLIAQLRQCELLQFVDLLLERLDLDVA
jgi:hypothetical protein